MKESYWWPGLLASFETVCRDSERRSSYLRWVVMIQNEVILSFSIYRTQSSHYCWLKPTMWAIQTVQGDKSIAAIEITKHKKTVYERLKNASMSKVCMRAWREQGPGHSALFNPACASLRFYSLNPYKVLEKAMKEHFNRLLKVAISHFKRGYCVRRFIFYSPFFTEIIFLKTFEGN